MCCMLTHLMEKESQPKLLSETFENWLTLFFKQYSGNEVPPVKDSQQWDELNILGINSITF